MIQEVVKTDLNLWRCPGNPGYAFAELDRQLRFRLSDLEPGALVRIDVHSFKPVPGYVGWYRHDCIFQVVADDSDVTRAWRHEFEQVAA